VEENRAPITADIPRATRRIQAVSGIRRRFDSAWTNAASIPRYRVTENAYSIRARAAGSAVSLTCRLLLLRGFSAKFSAHLRNNDHLAERLFITRDLFIARS